MVDENKMRGIANKRVKVLSIVIIDTYLKTIDTRIPIDESYVFLDMKF